MGIYRTNRGERGNIATVLFGAVAMVGVVSAATMQMISGPIRTASQVNNKNLVESQLQIGARLIVLNAATTDDDGDTTIEPIEHDGVNIGLTGGGGIPVSTGASLTDPWNSPYGYCVWDNGVDTTIDAGENRLSGDNTGSALAIALISAGPNRVFETDCYDYSGSPTGVDKPSGSDDYVFKYTYAEAAQTGAGLWEIGATNPDDDVVVKSSGGAETVVVDKELGIGTFMGLVTPLLVGNGGAGNDELEISAAGGVGFGTGSPAAQIHIVDDTNAGIRYEQYNTADGANYRNYRARGTIALPSQVVNGDRLASFLAGGYGSTGFSGPNGGLSIVAAEDFTDTNAGTHLIFGTSATGTNPAGGGVERMRITSDGNVGIGETVPLGILHVSDTAGTSRFVRNHTSGGRVLSFYNQAAEAGYIGVGASASLMTISATNYLRFDTGGGTDRMRITSDGKLEFSGVANVDVATSGETFTIFKSADGTNLPAGSANGSLVFQNTDGNSATPDGDFVWINRGNDGVPDIDMILTGAGSLGVGVNAPSASYKLHVGGNSYFDGNILTGGSNGGMVFAPRDGTGSQFVIYNPTGDQLRFWVNGGGGDKMAMDIAGNFGIGTNVPRNKLHLHEGSSAFANIQFTNDTTGQASGSSGFRVGLSSNEDALLVNNTAGKDMLFYTEESERMRILNNGNVGIGETQPDYKLHITGNADAPGSGFNGGAPMLRLEGANAAWSEPAIDFVEQSNAPIARIAAKNTGSGAGDLHFMTRVAAGSLASRMVISDDGNVGFGGETNPNAPIEIQMNGGGMALQYDQNTAADLYERFHVPGVSWWTVGPKADGDFWFARTSNHTGTPNVEMRTNGDLAITGNLVFVSDRKEKKDIKNIGPSLDKLTKLNGVNYLWKDDSKSPVLQYGLIAQDVEEIYPELVDYNAEINMKSVNYVGLIAPMIESIKELKAENEALKKVQAENADLKDRVERLELLLLKD